MVNAQTFDLMDIFRDQIYFHPAFQGSSSIKKVLPVLTDISYDGLAIPNGGVAAEKLLNMISGRSDDVQTVRKNLLQYCKQDTWAMVVIWEELKKFL